MAFKLFSDVRETSTSGGTGNQVLSGALDGSYKTFGSVYADGDTFFYCMKLGAAREIGKGTYLAGSNSIARTQVYKSTNADALVNFPNGTVDIFVTNIAPDDLDAAGLGQYRDKLGAMPAMSIDNVAARAGGFEVWQRGTPITLSQSTTKYTCDGWYISTAANQNAAVIRQAGLAAGSRHCCYVQRQPGSTGAGTMRFAMPLDEGEVAALAGNYVALSFVMKEGANPSFGHNIAVNLYVGTGAVAKRNATAYSSETAPISQVVATSTTPTRFAFTSPAVVPANTTQAEIQFSWTPSGTAGADDSFSIDDLQIEIVPAPAYRATPFQRISFSEQLRLCLPHYEKSYNYDTVPGAAVGNGNNGLLMSAPNGASGIHNWTFQAPKRKPLAYAATPGLRLYDGSGNPDAFSYYIAAWNSGGIISNAGHSATEKFGSLFWSGGPNVVYVGFDYVADASI